MLMMRIRPQLIPTLVVMVITTLVSIARFQQSVAPREHNTLSSEKNPNTKIPSHVHHWWGNFTSEPWLPLVRLLPGERNTRTGENI